MGDSTAVPLRCVDCNVPLADVRWYQYPTGQPVCPKCVIPPPTPPSPSEQGGWRTGRLDMRTLAPDEFSEEQVYVHYLYPPGHEGRPDDRIAFYGVAGTDSDPRLVSQQVADLLNRERTARQRAERERDAEAQSHRETIARAIHEQVRADKAESEAAALRSKLEAAERERDFALALAEEVVDFAAALFVSHVAPRADEREPVFVKFRANIAALKGEGGQDGS